LESRSRWDSSRRWPWPWPALAAAATSDSRYSPAGIALALAAGCAWASVAYTGQRVGQRTKRVDGLALAIPIAALITLPFGLAHVRALDAHTLGVGALIAAGGLILPFALELEGLRRLEPRTVAIIYSVDPAIAALVGLAALGQSLTTAQGIGITAVIVASAAATASAQPQ
jgi:inner membrane transporter RhtA